MDCDVAGYHVRAFNYTCEEGIAKAVRDIPAEKFRLKGGEAVEFSYATVQLGKPTLSTCNVNVCLN
jgi:hypothetical protein